MTATFRKRPVEVTAVEWSGNNFDEVTALTGPTNFDTVEPEDRGDDPEITAQVFDKLPSTWVGVKTGQWIIRGVVGEFYPIDPGVLADTYERVESDPGA